MPHIKKQKQRMKKDIELRLRNRAYKSQVKTAKKKVLTATQKEEATALLQQFYKIADTVAGKKILHKNKVARDKSRLSKYVKSLG